MLADQVFNRIARRLTARSSNIRRFTEEGYSFEEWCNWEAFAACDHVSGWEVHAKPRYSEISKSRPKKLADLLIKSGSKTIVVEIGLVHDNTFDKWRSKLDGDRRKLRCKFSDNVSPLHIIIFASVEHADISKGWKTWLAKLSCWKCETRLRRKVKLAGDGQMLILGWTDILPRS